MNKVIRHAAKICYAVGYYLFTSIIPKNKSLWVFGAWKGTSYSDNTKYLFEYVLENHPEINAVWITKNSDVFKQLQSEGKPVVLYPSHKAKKLIKRAKFAFQTEGNRDTGMYQVGGVQVVQLFHGIPAKHLNWYKNYSKLKRFLINIESGNHGKSIWVSSSQFYENAFREIFKLPVKCQFVNTGHPRCDVAYKNQKSDLVQELRSQYDKVVLYLPTHRNFGVDFDNEFLIRGLCEIDKRLENTGICFLFKPHPNEIALFKTIGAKFTNVKVLDGSNIMEQDVYSYVYQCDALVSDYSSIIYDYLCVNRPIILFDYDLENYKQNDAGLFADYFNYPVGPICVSWNEMIEKLLSEMQEDSWIQSRVVAMNHFNKYSDGTSCRKIVEYCKRRC